MRIALPPPKKALQLAPFLLLSLLLHVAILTLVRPLAKNSSVTPQLSIEVYLLASNIAENINLREDKVLNKVHLNPARKSVFPETLAPPPVMPPIPAETSRFFDSQKFMESAKSIAQDEARKSERQIAALEKKRLNTPVGMLEQYLRLPHEEIRLTNGILKITTSIGTICFQPVPYFARDAAGVFGVPTTCP